VDIECGSNYTWTMEESSGFLSSITGLLFLYAGCLFGDPRVLLLSEMLCPTDIPVKSVEFLDLG
jgi:hypothetical protein